MVVHAELVRIHAFIAPVIRDGSRIGVTRACVC
jgi:hypothetical protein